MTPFRKATPTPGRLRIAGLFAGIGGIELGMHRAGHESVLLCEIDAAATSVLRMRFPDVPIKRDVRELERLPNVELVAAGFPCQDLSQAGRTAGIRGRNSGLVEEVFRLLRDAPSVQWLLLENVPFMLQLDRGGAMRYLTRRSSDSASAGPTASSTRERSASRNDGSACCSSPRGARSAARAARRRRGAPSAPHRRRARLRLLLDGGHPRTGLGRRRRPDAQGRLLDRYPVPTCGSAAERGDRRAGDPRRRTTAGVPGRLDAARSGGQPPMERFAGSSSATQSASPSPDG